MPKELTKAEKVVTWFLPNGGDIIFALVIAILLWVKPNFIFGDGSTGWHLFSGNYILHQGVPHHDLMSYTFPHQAWVDYEWFSDALMASVVNVVHGDLNLLAVFTTCAIGALMVLLYDRCRREGANFGFAFVLVVIGALVSIVHWLARPHLFTFFGVYFFTTWMEDFWHGTITRKRLLISMPLLMVLWTNTHPAFLLGFVLIGVYLGCSAVLYALDKEELNLERLKSFSLVALLCAVATLINPYGVDLHKFIMDYARGTPDLAKVTSEFLSPVFHGALQPSCLEILCGLFVLGLGLTKTKLSLPRLITCLGFLHLTLSGVRNMPLFAIVVLPAIAQLFSAVSLGLNEDQEQMWWKGFKRRWIEFNAGLNENELLCSKHLISVVFALVLAVAALDHGHLLGSQLFNSSWDDSTLPTGTLKALGQKEQSGELNPLRGFNTDNWGGYLRYRLDKPVFIDDRAEFYGEPFFLQYMAVAFAQPTWKEELDGKAYATTEQNGSSVQWLLVPKGSKIADVLTNDPAWGAPADQDKVAALFIRKAAK